MPESSRNTTYLLTLVALVLFGSARIYGHRSSIWLWVGAIGLGLYLIAELVERWRGQAEFSSKAWGKLLLVFAGMAAVFVFGVSQDPPERASIPINAVNRFESITIGMTREEASETILPESAGQDVIPDSSGPDHVSYLLIRSGDVFQGTIRFEHDKVVSKELKAFPVRVIK